MSNCIETFCFYFCVLRRLVILFFYLCPCL